MAILTGFHQTLLPLLTIIGTYDNHASISNTVMILLLSKRGIISSCDNLDKSQTYCAQIFGWIIEKNDAAVSNQEPELIP